MLDFQRGPKPRNFLSRREQRRLLFLVLTLGLVLFLVFEARKPKYYQWIVAPDRGGEDPPAVGKASSDDRQIDTRVPPDPRTEEFPGTFFSPEPPDPDQATPPRYFPGVKPSYLKSVRDNRLLGPSEWAAWMHLFHVLEQTDEPTLERASSGRVSFVQLFEQSSAYRGELVTTAGTIRRAHPAKTPKNEHGLTDYYQAWLQPVDHPADPIAVWCLRLPKDLPTGMEIAEDVEVTGFYFKLLAYKAADGKIRRAPMLLARNVRWKKKPAVVEVPRPGPIRLLWMIAGSAAFAVLATAYVYYRTRAPAPARREFPARRRTVPGGDASSDVVDALQRFADTETDRGP